MIHDLIWLVPTEKINQDDMLKKYVKSLQENANNMNSSTGIQ